MKRIVFAIVGGVLGLLIHPIGAIVGGIIGFVAGGVGRKASGNYPGADAVTCVSCGMLRKPNSAMKCSCGGSLREVSAAAAKETFRRK